MGSGRQAGSSGPFELYLVGLGVPRRLTAGSLHVDLLICAYKGIWIPRYVGVRAVGNPSTVQASYVVEHVYYPLTIDQLGSARSNPSFYVGASITAGTDVPIGHRFMASWIGLGKDVVAAHHGSGGRGCSCCSGSYGGDGRCCGHRTRNVHAFSPRLGKYSICLVTSGFYSPWPQIRDRLSKIDG
jgi:hypothetical protein